MNESLAAKIRLANTTLITEGDLGAIEDFFASTYVAHTTEGDMKKGLETVRAFLTQLRRSFTDIEIDVGILVEGENRVAWQRTWEATHEAAFMGFPATGRRIKWRDMVTSEFRDGLIAEDWVITDLAERLLVARKRRGER